MRNHCRAAGGFSQQSKGEDESMHVHRRLLSAFHHKVTQEFINRVLMVEQPAQSCRHHELSTSAATMVDMLDMKEPCPPSIKGNRHLFLIINQV